MQLEIQIDTKNVYRRTIIDTERHFIIIEFRKKYIQAHKNTYVNMHSDKHSHMYIYIYIERERERQTDRKTERESEKVTDR